MRVLITGATGLIGRALTQSLLDKGLRPRIVTRRPHRVLESFDSRVLAYEWHPRTEPFPPGALDGVERVIHLMGEPLHGPLTREKRAQIVASRRNGTERLIEALADQPVHLIVASSAAVYGFGEGPPLPRVQRRQETQAQACPGAARLRGGCRPPPRQRLDGHSGPHGPRDRPRRVPGPDVGAAGTALRLARHPSRGGHSRHRPGGRRIAAPVAHVEPPVPGPLHAVAPEPLRSADLKQLLAQALPLTRVPLPHMVLRRRIGGLADFLHSRKRILPERAIEAGFQFARPDPIESVRSVLAEHVARAAPRRPSLLGAVLQRT